MSVASPWNAVAAMAIAPRQQLDNATVFGKDLGHECPSYGNRRDSDFRPQVRYVRGTENHIG